LVEQTGKPEENLQPNASHWHWSHKVDGNWNHNVNDDRYWLRK